MSLRHDERIGGQGMNVYYFIQKNKNDGKIVHLIKRKLDKTRDEVVDLIKKQNDSSDYNIKTELVEDEKMIELFYYAKKMETDSDLDDVLDHLRDIEYMIERFIDNKK